MTLGHEALALLGVGLSLSCASGRSSEVLHGPLSLNPGETRGQRSFFHHCNKCHPQGDSGVGPALNNKPLPDGAIQFQVRQGLGAMPSFSDRELPEPELQELLRYLHALREHP